MQTGFSFSTHFCVMFDSRLSSTMVEVYILMEEVPDKTDQCDPPQLPKFQKLYCFPVDS